MSSEKLRDLRERLMEKLAERMQSGLTDWGSRDVIESMIDLQFSGCKGVENQSGIELLEHYKDEMHEFYEIELEHDRYHDESNEAIAIRDLANQYELELVAEKELLGEVDEMNEMIERHLETYGIWQSHPDYCRLRGMMRSLMSKNNK